MTETTALVRLLPEVHLFFGNHGVSIVFGSTTLAIIDDEWPFSASGSMTANELLDLLESPDAATAKLIELRVLEFALVQTGAELFSFRIMFSDLLPNAQNSPSDNRLALSRFALLRRVGERVLIESPLSSLRITSTDKRFICSLLHPEMDGPAYERIDPAVIELLRRGSILVDPSRPERPDAAGWEFHDLYFHARSRSGRHSSPVGRRPEALTLSGFPPAPTPEATVQLPVTHFQSRSTPLEEISLKRASYRIWGEGDDAITSTELAMFLYRCGAFREEGERSRPVPSAGGLDEIETHLVINECRGLAPGWYVCGRRPGELDRLAARPAYSRTILVDAARSMAAKRMPNVLLLLVARFSVAGTAYSSIAYANILKDAGARIQQFYLVATEMRLAGCAIGAGDIRSFEMGTGYDWLERGSVAEFALGARAKPVR